ncbi:MAG: hypothetical protein KDD34_06570, partial [Bdellovibrionales bacterium]|nr:hypothetical protein [Bdellovibrionales bacterium]
KRKMFLNKKRAHFLKTVSSSSGQGVIEYILVLVVTVAMVVGMLVQLNKAFEVWLNNYFGEYLACLLETGEIPSLGGPSTGICARYWSPFSLKLDPLGKNNQGQGGNLSGGSSARKGPSDGASSSSPSASRGGVSSQRSSSPSGDFGFGNRFPSRGVAAGGGFGKDQAAAKSKTNTGNTNVSTPQGLLSANRGEDRFLVPPESLDQRFSMTKAQDDEREKKQPIAKKDTGDERGARGPTSFKTTAQLKKSKGGEVDVSLGFGDYLRYLLIAAIIIAIVIFFGGQVLQMSKSMD